ncbi:hypothetical protein C1645_832024 [Glomus cerebriforme]|uniref:Uncharacterized protein n=1 Tax=Glomus cerebriforme TaxID=658196 RepID=A0A397SI93_9GLOM|nr:hypothetical protein C1645_832024 [Glomus cerebriforme]
MTGVLGVRFLDKLERVGIFDLQHESLKAFSPLFPVAGKSNYTRSVTYHIYCIENDPQIVKI